MTKVKICGITRSEDAELAAELGADFLGFVFVPESPRCVTPHTVPLPGRAGGPLRVGVFRNASRDTILRTIDVARLDVVQIHGRAVEDLGVPTIRAFHVGNALPDTTTRADYILFDTGGGTGRTFDWSLLATYRRTIPFFVAGGIHPGNVAEAIAATRPFAIDLASGVESAPGIKDHDRLRKLFEAISR